MLDLVRRNYFGLFWRNVCLLSILVVNFMKQGIIASLVNVHRCDEHMICCVPRCLVVTQGSLIPFTQLLITASHAFLSHLYVPTKFCPSVLS